jgi:hypothetical protein
MKLGDSEIQAAYYGLAGFVRQQVLARRVVPPEVATLVARLDTVVRMTPTRHETSCDPINPPHSEVWIGATDAATLLDRNGQAGLRWIQRNAARIGGRKVSGRWLFPESTVIDYAAERLTHAEPNP